MVSQPELIIQDKFYILPVTNRTGGMYIIKIPIFMQYVVTTMNSEIFNNLTTCIQFIVRSQESTYTIN